MREVYLDNAATTKVRKEVKEVMEPLFSDNYGNPSSLHKKGRNARDVIENAKYTISKILNCKPDEIIFTSGGSEANNQATIGYAFPNVKERGSHIVTTKIEHPSILEPCKFLENQMFDVTYMKSDSRGMIDPENIEKSITEKTTLVSVIYANNEIGTIQNIKDISSICKENDIVLHIDACQASPYLTLDVEELGVDMMTLNASKCYGPKGIGLLYVRDGIKIDPIIYGGGQQNNKRSGTENVPDIVGFAKALGLAQKEREDESERLSKLKKKLEEGLLENDNTILNNHPTHSLPNNVNISFVGQEAESLVLKLDEKGIYVGTGSACASQKKESSHVLRAIGRNEKEIKGSIRFTLGRETTEEDIEYTIKTVNDIL